MKYNSILISSSWGGVYVCLYAITLTWDVGVGVCTLLPSLW